MTTIRRYECWHWDGGATSYAAQGCCSFCGAYGAQWMNWPKPRGGLRRGLKAYCDACVPAKAVAEYHRNHGE